MTKARELADLIANVNHGSSLGNKNFIQNGAMNVSQRATSSTGIGASSGYFTLDRWNIYALNTAGRLTMTQDSSGPSGFANSLKVAYTTADTSIAAGENLLLQQRIEGQNLQAFAKGTSDAKPFAVSFYVKGNASATYICELHDQDNGRQISKTFNVTTAWTRIELTFPADTTGAFDDDNARSLNLNIALHAGSTYTSGTLSTTWTSSSNADRYVGGSSFFDSTSRTFFITGVQLEIGEKATVFEHEPYETTFNRCLRYFNRITGYNTREFAGYNENTTKGLHVFRFAVKMRGNPTIGVSGTVSNYIIAYSNTQIACNATLGFNTTHPEGVTFYSSVASGLTAGGASCLRNIDYIDLKAEL
jgi:hypothetical protein